MKKLLLLLLVFSLICFCSCTQRFLSPYPVLYTGKKIPSPKAPKGYYRPQMAGGKLLYKRTKVGR